MQGPARSEPHAPESSRLRRTGLLLELLEDDSPLVLANVRDEFGRLGRRGAAALRRAARGGSPRGRGRARQLLLEHARRRAVRRLVRYAARSEHDLETALVLLDGHGAPGEDLRGYRRVLDALGAELRRRIGRQPMGRRRIEELVEYLAGEVGFAGASEAFHHPDNIYLHRAIDRREGMPLTLCAIYRFVAQRAGLRAGLLPFPGHVLLAVTDGGERVILDPFGGGATLTERGCMHYLAQHGLPYRGGFFSEAPDGFMLLRQVTNLIHSCRQRGRAREAADLGLVSSVLARQTPERGRR